MIAVSTTVTRHEISHHTRGTLHVVDVEAQYDDRERDIHRIVYTLVHVLTESYRQPRAVLAEHLAAGELDEWERADVVLAVLCEALRAARTVTIAERRAA